MACGAFLTVVAVVALTAYARASATGSSALPPGRIDPVFELRDRLVWLSAVATAGGLGLLLALTRGHGRRLLTSWPVVALTVVGAAGVALSAAWVDPRIGLGPQNFLVALVLAPLLLYAVGSGTGRAVRLLWPVVAVGGLAVYAPALWQTPDGMYDSYHASRVIDEMLGPAAGELPLSDYVPQYGGLLGLPLAPFRRLVAQDVEGWVMAYLSVLSLVTVLLLCAAAARMLPKGRRALAPLLVVPVLLMKPSASDALTPAGLQRLFQTLPERSLLPAVLAVVLLHAVARPASTSRWLWVGAVAGAATLANVESGAPATVAAVLVLLTARAGARALGLLVAGWAGAAVAYTAMLLLAGGPVRPEYLVGFSLEFAAGFASLPMPAYGTYVFVLFVLVASVGSALPALWKGAGPQTTAAAGGLFFGAWGLMMFPYYVGRSSSFGQLQFFLLPASVSAVWLLVAAAVVVGARRPTPRLVFAVLLAGLPAAVFAATVLKAPSPEVSATRLSGGFAPAGEFRSTASKRQPVVDEQQAQQIRAVGDTLPGPVGQFYTSGNLVSLKTGLPNASVLAVPEELLPRRPWSGDPDDLGNAAFRTMQCRSLEESDLRSVVVELSIAQGLAGCSGFTRMPAAGPERQALEQRGMAVFLRDAT